jgi:hypothetical protein
MMHSDPPADPSAPTPGPAAATTPAEAPVANADAIATAPASPEPPAPPITPAPYTPPPRVRRCENCATPLLGEHCYACGQPTKGLIRQFGTILGDFLDTVLNIDSRVFRTIPPLLLHPGRLTLEYFAGHRVRFVSPVRLFVFLSILAFLAAQWALNFSGDGANLQIGGGEDTATQIDRAQTEADVVKLRDEAVAQLEKAKLEGKKVPGLALGMDAGIREVRAQADARLAELRGDAKSAPKSPAPPKPPGVTPAPGSAPGVGPPPGTSGVDKDGILSFNGTPWDAKTNPIAIGWLPDAGNAKLNEWAGRAQANIRRLRESKDGNLLKDAFLSVVPQTLFVLLPVFALLLKVLYLFKRRLYMEHLVVALHSHAFLCLVLLLQSLLSLLDGAVSAPDGIVSGLFGWVEVGLWIWAPVYLLWMQKRVYGQGWIMTFLKFCAVGVAYLFLLSFAGAAALLVSLVRM